MRKLHWAAIAALASAATASSRSTSRPDTLFAATRLVQECRATIADYDTKGAQIGTDGTQCLGYVQGFLETTLMWQVANKNSEETHVPQFCLTPKATYEVIIRKIPIWAIEHPEDLRESAIEFLMSMLVGSYPCAK